MDMRIQFDVAGSTGAVESAFSIDGEAVTFPSAGYDLYVNETFCGIDRFELTNEILLSHGVELPEGELIGDGKTASTLRSAFGLRGALARPDSYKLCFSLTKLGSAPKGMESDMYVIDWMWPGELLDSFILVTAIDAEMRRGVLVRFRHDTGVQVTGQSSGLLPEEGAETGSNVWWRVTPYVKPMVVPQPDEGMAWQDYGAKGWWIEQFPRGKDLPRE